MTAARKVHVLSVSSAETILERVRELAVKDPTLAAALARGGVPPLRLCPDMAHYTVGVDHCPLCGMSGFLGPRITIAARGVERMTIYRSCSCGETAHDYDGMGEYRCRNCRRVDNRKRTKREGAS